MSSLSRKDARRYIYRELALMIASAISCDDDWLAKHPETQEDLDEASRGLLMVELRALQKTFMDKA